MGGLSLAKGIVKLNPNQARCMLQAWVCEAGDEPTHRKGFTKIRIKTGRLLGMHHAKAETLTIFANTVSPQYVTIHTTKGEADEVQMMLYDLASYYHALLMEDGSVGYPARLEAMSARLPTTITWDAGLLTQDPFVVPEERQQRTHAGSLGQPQQQAQQPQPQARFSTVQAGQALFGGTALRHTRGSSSAGPGGDELLKDELIKGERMKLERLKRERINAEKEEPQKLPAGQTSFTENYVMADRDPVP